MKQTRDPKTLKVRPCVDVLPMLADDDPQMLSLIASVEEKGVQDPLTIDQNGDVVDGRHRRVAAVKADRADVPIVQKHFASDEEALQFALMRLFDRRHYTDSARAYTFAKLHADSLTEKGKAIRKANLGISQIPQESSKVENSTFGNTGDRVSTLFGFSRDRWFQAIKVLKLFVTHPQFAAQFEPQILSGEKSLWNVISAIDGATAENNKGRVDSRVTFDESIEDWVKLGVHRFKRYWPRLKTQAARYRIGDLVAEELIEAMPAEVCKRIEKKLRERKQSNS